MKTVINLLFNTAATLFGGFVFSHLWNWFIAPKFNLPTLNFFEAVGVLFVMAFPLIGIIVSQGVKEMKEKRPDISDTRWSIATSIVMMTFVYPILLGTAYLWHLVIG